MQLHSVGFVRRYACHDGKGENEGGMMEKEEGPICMKKSNCFSRAYSHKEALTQREEQFFKNRTVESRFAAAVWFDGNM